MTVPAYVERARTLNAIVSRVREIARQHAREDLDAKLGDARETLSDGRVRVVVVGQFKQGKSALVNALVAAPVCPVDDVIATSVPTVVSWGKTPTAALVTEMQGAHEALRTSIDPTQLRRHVTELAGEVGFLGSVHAEVTLPRPILADGFTFVDTPGAGRAQSRVSTNLTLLPQADAALMVTDATQELTDPELSFLTQAAVLCPRTACVVSKIDLQYEWRDIVATNEQHLRGAETQVPVLANSALLHSLATERNDAVLMDDSRITELRSYLQGQVKNEVIASRQAVVAEQIHLVVGHLMLGLESELRGLGSAREGEAVVQSLQQAEAQAQQLVARSARWQQTLSDGVGDLLSDIEFDLRDRLREVGREAEQLIALSDPGKSWEETGTWLADTITQAVSDNFVWAHRRSLHLAEVVAGHFSIDGKAAMPELMLADIDGVLSELAGPDHVAAGKLSVGQKLMIGLKGSYGGVLMFGLMTTLAGMALVNPISLAAGLVMGGFAYRQDSQQRLEQRRSEARAAVRKLIDETLFQVGKESRDRMGRVKRTLRDHFVGVAEDLKTSLNVSVKLARQGSQLPQSERATRIEQLEAELAHLHDLRSRAAAIAESYANEERNGDHHA